MKQLTNILVFVITFGMLSLMCMGWFGFLIFFEGSSSLAIKNALILSGLTISNIYASYTYMRRQRLNTLIKLMLLLDCSLIIYIFTDYGR